MLQNVCFYEPIGYDRYLHAEQARDIESPPLIFLPLGRDAIAKFIDSGLEAPHFKLAHTDVGHIRVYSLPLVCPMFLFPPGSAV